MTEQNNDHGLDMDFLSEEVLAELDKALDPSLVKSYEGPGGKRLSYIETHTAISNANRIFKPANWGPRVLEGPTLHHINITVSRVRGRSKRYTNTTRRASPFTCTAGSSPATRVSVRWTRSTRVRSQR